MEFWLPFFVFLSERTEKLILWKVCMLLEGEV